MTDPDLVAKKLALIETCVEQLRSLARPDGYQDVDLGVVEDVLRNHLGDLLAFVAAIRGRPASG